MLDFVLDRTNTEAPNEIQWNHALRLNGIDYADAICLMVYRIDDIKDKLGRPSK